MARRRSRGGKPQIRTERQVIAESAPLDLVLDPGAMIDSDDYLYRPLTGQRGSNLPAFQHERMLAIAKYLFRTNGVGNRLLTLITDFMLGEGVTLSYQNSAVQAVIERHWKDPYNDWERNQDELLQMYLVFGELLLPLFPNAQDGHLRVGCVLPEQIAEVALDSENWRIVTGVTLRAEGGATQGKTYSAVNVRDDRNALDGVTNPTLFWRRGNPFGTRGLSILYTIADYCDMLDQFLFSEVERWALLKAFVWDVTVTGSTPEQISELAKAPEFQPPTPGAVRVHNDRVTWEALAPKLETLDAVNGLTFLRNHILGAIGIPEHWYSEGGHVNRASAVTMAEAPRKRFTKLQDEWRYILTDVLQAQVDYAVNAGELSEMVQVEDEVGEPKEGAKPIPAREAFKVGMPDLSGSDTQQLATAIGLLETALMGAQESDHVSAQTARRAFLALLSQMGVEFDLGEEEQRIEQQVADKQQQREQFLNSPQAQQPPAPLVSLMGGRQTQENPVNRVAGNDA